MTLMSHPLLELLLYLAYLSLPCRHRLARTPRPMPTQQQLKQQPASNRAAPDQHQLTRNAPW